MVNGTMSLGRIPQRKLLPLFIYAALDVTPMAFFGTVSASALVQEVALPYNAAITNAYDGNARMTATTLVNSGGRILDSGVYTYNVGNQRIMLRRTVENANPNTAGYTYDPIGQVIADQAFEDIVRPRLNEQLHYVFDPAGNLSYRTNVALIENFQVNTLNELTTNTNGGTLTVMGTTTSQATNVTVNSTSAQLYGDATFAASGLPLTTTYTATASDGLGRSATNTVSVSIAANTTFQYDGNGNLTNDGLRSFAYDDENQLIQVWVPGQWLSQFTYDGKMRRRIRQEFTLQGTNWVQTNEVFYVYDGNVVIQERDINNLPTTTYTRGKDLSGSLEGAGGIGGLLARTSQTYADGPLAGQSYYHSDGNGNVTMLINSSNAVVARYLYDAFGNILSKSGLLANANLYRFSSKEAHPNSGLVYYLYRYYDPNLQRFLNRDPIGERGGINLYTYAGNNPISQLDPLGLCPPTNFVGKFFRSFSLFNQPENLEETALGVPFKYAALKTMENYAPMTAGVLENSLPVVGVALTIAATAGDLPEQFVSEAVQNLPVDPTINPYGANVDMGGGVYMTEEYQGLY
jgi:RHS repeat-associated protein